MRIVAKQTYITQHKDEAYSTLFEVMMNGQRMGCRNNDGAFITAVNSALSGLTTVQGEAYSLVSVDVARTALAKKMSYSLYLTRVIAESDFTKVENALSQAWRTKTSR